MKMLKTKHFRRIVVFLAMIAPAVYLFGSLFSALAGAHGQQVFADSLPTEVTTHFDNESFMEHAQLGSTYGDYYTTGSREWASCYFRAESPFNLIVNDEIRTSAARFVFSIYDDSGAFVSNQQMVGANIGNVSYTGDYSRFGVSWYSIIDPAALVTDYSFDIVQPINNLLPVEYSDYIFGNFFDKDNFLVKIGEDVLSENPHGFVPFASFWKYLDENMLHMGNLQIGLMGYGFVYYACHVLLFDIAFILVTFFLDFIQKVNDKVVGGVD